MMLAKGTLVEVKDDALARMDMQHNGPLWVVVREHHPDPLDGRLVPCKSIATGVHDGWFVEELNIAEKELPQP